MKDLTLRYSATQFSHWAATTGAVSFATTYLMEKGLPSQHVGLLLAAAGLLSCITQPLLAAAADRARRVVIKPLLLTMSLVCCLCFSLQWLKVSPLVLGILYMVGVWSSDAMLPLLNTLSVAYPAAGYPVNYGAARAVGSAASALSTLLIGSLISMVGIQWMLLFFLSFRLLNMGIVARYPDISKPEQTVSMAGQTCSIPQFLSRYRWYCFSLLGVLFLGMYHAMTENYMIAIMARLGGNSKHVGTALFISSLSAAPVIFCFHKVRRHIRDSWLFKISALSFLVKSILVCFAPSIVAIYLVQLLQITSYGFLGPVQVYYARARVRSCDMVKGQAFITAAYALGCAGGNFTGGQLLTWGVDTMLHGGIVMAAAGAVILFLTVDKQDIAATSEKLPQPPSQ